MLDVYTLLVLIFKGIPNIATTESVFSELKAETHWNPEQVSIV